ncbi:MAG: class I SAM-dependent methyltransferase [Nitrospinae bacterium]|nr:class I SAM-dependent methyltransferase [Nitrospinota bacterium]
MTSFYSRHYWRIGFQSRLYDLLTPEAYTDSLRRVVACAPGGSGSSGKLWLDAGCGSGALVGLLEDRLRQGDRYVGIDRLLPGLIAARRKATALDVLDRVRLLQSDLGQPLPLAPTSVDVIVAHFSLYTIGDRRERVLKQFRELLAPGGMLVVVEPAPEYDARRIIEESIFKVRERSGIFKARMKEWLVYPLTYRFGLKFIEGQLKNNIWHASSREALCAEIRRAGFEVKHVEPAYAGSANRVTAG